MKVALLANLKKNAPTWAGCLRISGDDLDSEKTIEAIMAALESNGHDVTFLEGNLSLVDKLPKLQPDICFNICEGHFGGAREAQIPRCWRCCASRTPVPRCWPWRWRWTSP
ncbi:MAG: hypothetical protein R3A10_19240 [Caldilineaceae bacterium]